MFVAFTFLLIIFLISYRHILYRIFGVFKSLQRLGKTFNISAVLVMQQSLISFIYYYLLFQFKAASGNPIPRVTWKKEDGDYIYIRKQGNRDLMKGQHLILYKEKVFLTIITRLRMSSRSFIVKNI